MRAQKTLYPSLSFRKSRRNPERWKALGASALVLALGTGLAMPADARARI